MIALIVIIAVAYFWANRARNTHDVVGEVADMSDDVRIAARRFGVSRQMNMHPVESIEDPRLAIAAIGAAFIELDALPTADQRQLLTVQIRSTLRVDTAEAGELNILGRWLMTQCGGAEPAIARLSRKLYKLGGTEQMAPLMSVLDGSVTNLSDRQRDAVEDITRAMRVR